MKHLWHADIKHPLLFDWLRGTTCYRPHVYREVLFENEVYIVFKHGSHPEYINRFDGSKTCRAYAALYRKTDLKGRTLYYGDNELRRWEGRVSKKTVLAECAQMGIVFDPINDSVALP